MQIANPFIRIRSFSLKDTPRTVPDGRTPQVERPSEKQAAVRPAGLEIHTGSQKHIARGKCGRCLAETAIGKIRIDAIQVDAIEQVEGIETEFEAYSLADL